MGILKEKRDRLSSMKKQMSQINIIVRNPVTHEDDYKKPIYTTYEVSVETANKSFCLECSSIRRRFSEFDWLNKMFRSHHPNLTPPSLPPKKFFSKRFDRDFIIFRMKGLEEYLNKVIKEKFYLSDVCLHLFLQTDLTTQEIEDFLTGKISPSVIDDLWKCGGIKTMCKYFQNSNASRQLAEVHDFQSDYEYSSNTSEDEGAVSSVSNSRYDESIPVNGGDDQGSIAIDMEKLQLQKTVDGNDHKSHVTFSESTDVPVGSSINAD